MTKKRILVVSLALNALLFICICGVAFHYRGKIIEKVQKELGMYNSPSEEYLANFNNEPLEAVNDSLMIGADSTITCLFLGNSLTYCGVAEEEPDFLRLLTLGLHQEAVGLWGLEAEQRHVVGQEMSITHGYHAGNMERVGPDSVLTGIRLR